jgi:uncharacterized protein (DUF488 family)
MAINLAHPFFTVGHSRRLIAQFAALLTASRVELVVDVRTIPRSRANPQYDGRALGETLSQFAIAYRHIAGLGGLRGKQPVPGEVNAFWQNQSFHNYADYALSPAFGSALEMLVALGRKQRCAIMCAEAVWWRCHRRIIADYLLARGETVFHILDENHIEPARLTEAANPGSEGSLIYPAAPSG